MDQAAMNHTMSADRTRSRKARAGSRRNKQLRNVGMQRSDSNWHADKFQHWLPSAKPGHAARALAGQDALRGIFTLPVAGPRRGIRLGRQ